MQEKDGEKPQKVAKEVKIDQFRYNKFMQDIRDNQNLGLAVIGGLGAALLGAVCWAAIVAVSNYQLGIVAIGIGWLVGQAIRRLGNGIDIQFGIAGGIISLLGIIAGNALVICILLSKETGLGLFEVIDRMTLDILIDWMRESFSPMDLLFYGIAVYYGYKHSIRHITEEELAKLAV